MTDENETKPHPESAIERADRELAELEESRVTDPATAHAEALAERAQRPSQKPSEPITTHDVATVFENSAAKESQDMSQFTIGHAVQMKLNPTERATVAGIEGDGILTLNFDNGTSGVGHASNWEPVPGLVQFSGEAVISMGSSLGGDAGVAPTDTSADAAMSFVDPAPEAEGGLTGATKTDTHDAEALAEHSLDAANEIRAGIAHTLLHIQKFQHANCSTDFAVVERLMNEALPWINKHVEAENAKLAEAVEKVKSGEWTATATLLPVGAES